jgi:hypothetical protein
VESYLRDARQLFVETQAVWGHPLSANEQQALSPKALLEAVHDFAEGPVKTFVLSETE